MPRSVLSRQIFEVLLLNIIFTIFALGEKSASYLLKNKFVSAYALMVVRSSQ